MCRSSSPPWPTSAAVGVDERWLLLCRPPTGKSHTTARPYLLTPLSGTGASSAGPTTGYAMARQSGRRGGHRNKSTRVEPTIPPRRAGISRKTTRTPVGGHIRADGEAQRLPLAGFGGCWTGCSDSDRLPCPFRDGSALDAVGGLSGEPNRRGQPVSGGILADRPIVACALCRYSICSKLALFASTEHECRH